MPGLLPAQEWNQSSPTPSMYINRPGTLSIGSLSNSGLAKFMVNDNTTSEPWSMLIHNPTGSAQLLRLKGGYPAGTQPIFQVEANNWAGSNYIEGEYRFTILAIGYVGIGTNTPAEKLDIRNGNFVIRNSGGTVNFKAQSDGFVGIGTASPAEKLDLKAGDFVIRNAAGTVNFKARDDGYVWARQIEVLSNGVAIPDYVFEPEYELMALPDLQAYIQTHRHLPGIKSRAEYEQTGSIDLGELQLQLLEKVEELTLHVIRLDQEKQALADRLLAMGQERAGSESTASPNMEQICSHEKE